MSDTQDMAMPAFPEGEGTATCLSSAAEQIGSDP